MAFVQHNAQTSGLHADIQSAAGPEQVNVEKQKLKKSKKENTKKTLI